MPETATAPVIVERQTVKVTPDGRVTREGAAVMIGVAKRTLDDWARSGKGPVPIRGPGKSFYRFTEVEDFIETFTGGDVTRDVP